MAKQFAIMRGDKLKTGEMRGSIAHVTRTQNTPNADLSKQHLNYAVVGPEWNDPKALQAAVEQQTPAKYRKDAVRLLEFVVTASPNWFKENPDDERRYFESAAQFFQNEYGSENVVSGVVHLDETSPHMHLYVVPVDPETGKLNAKKLFGGRGDMSRRQTAFAGHMAEFGVERGKSNPARKHTEVRDWYKSHADLDEREAALQDREKAASAELQEARIFHNDAREQLQAAWKTEEENDVRSHELYAERKSLDEREEALAAREKEVKYDNIDLQAREVEVAENLEEVSKRERRIQEQEIDLSRWANGLDERAENLSKHEQKVAQNSRELSSKSESLSVRAKALDERENALQRKSEAISDRERKLAALEHELEARGDKLAVTEGALEQRQAEIEKAGSLLRQRLNAARVAKEQFEQQKSKWIATNRPPDVPPIVQHLRELLDLGRIDRAERLDDWDAAGTPLYDYCDADGLTEKGHQLLQKHSDTLEHQQGFDAVFTSDGPR